MQQAREFNYEQAFARNTGLVSTAEQVRLRHCCVGLAGLGGVGGAHLQALARMGVGFFRLADPDCFEVVNFNRQFGATVETVGRNKAEAMGEIALSINPDASVLTFSEGINSSNIDAFLDGVDVVVDGIEFFCIETRRMLFGACRARGIPIVTAGPIGYGASVLVFTAESMSLEEFFGIEEGMTRAEQLLAFGLGLAPGLVSDVDPACVDVEHEKGPALASACMLCAAAAATEVLKLICGRGRPSLAPRGTYYDPFRGRTRALRPRPSLTRSLRGRVLRWFAFRRFPAFRAMHEREVAARETQKPEARSHKPVVEDRARTECGAVLLSSDF
jgi:molybdopterin/thiamine biosynthesis adenylyltransferase